MNTSLNQKMDDLKSEMSLLREELHGEVEQLRSEAYLGTSVFDFDNCAICQKVTDAASSEEQAEDEGTHSLSAPMEENRPGTPAGKLVDVEMSSPDESGKEVEDDKENHSPWTTSVQNSSYMGGRAAHVSPQNSKDEVETNRNFEGSSSALLAAAESKHKPSAMSQTTAKGGHQTVQLSKDDLAEFSVKHQSAEDSTKHQSAEDSTKHQSAEDSTKHQSAKDSMKHQSAEHSTADELEVLQFQLLHVEQGEHMQRGETDIRETGTQEMK
ncbi:hypothetical protein ACOMHN_003363 [Nucella lapillus]